MSAIYAARSGKSLPSEWNKVRLVPDLVQASKDI